MVKRTTKKVQLDPYQIVFMRLYAENRSSRRDESPVYREAVEYFLVKNKKELASRLRSDLLLEELRASKVELRDVPIEVRQAYGLPEEDI